MEALRKIIRKILFEYYNNQVVYSELPNKFPKFDVSEITPSDLNGESNSKISIEKKIGEKESVSTKKSSNSSIKNKSY